MTPYRKYLASEHWQNLRLHKLAVCNAVCHFCGTRSLSNDVHHVKYPKNLKDTTLKHLRVLCRGCHDAVHEILAKYPAINKEEEPRHRWRIVSQHMSIRLGYRLCFGGNGKPSVEIPRHNPVVIALKKARAHVIQTHHYQVRRKDTRATPDLLRWFAANKGCQPEDLLIAAARFNGCDITMRELTKRARKKEWRRYFGSVRLFHLGRIPSALPKPKSWMERQVENYS